MLSFAIFTSSVYVVKCKTVDEPLYIVALYITWSMAAVGLHIPTVNGAVSSAGA